MKLKIFTLLAFAFLLVLGCSNDQTDPLALDDPAAAVELQKNTLDADINFDLQIDLDEAKTLTAIRIPHDIH